MSASTENFSQDDLCDRELRTIERFLPLVADPARTGVRVIPGVKVSRKPDVYWNVRTLPPGLKQRATETQRSMDLLLSATETPRADDRVVAALHAAGFASVDQAPVLMIESDVYFRFLLSIIKARGGTLCLGCKVRPGDYSTQAPGPASSSSSSSTSTTTGANAVINCMGVAAASAGGAEGAYRNVRGEVLVFSRCPSPLPFYIIDDDKQSSLAQLPSGELYLCGEPLPRRVPGGYDLECTLDSLAGAADMCKALWGAADAPTLSDVSESWALDRPTRAEGFNVGVRKGSGSGGAPLLVDNSGHSGAGVAASWACAASVADALTAHGVISPGLSASAAARQASRL